MANWRDNEPDQQVWRAVRFRAARGALKLFAVSPVRERMVGDCAERQLGGFRVLLVDDNPDTNELVRELLIAEGASVEIAESGPEAFVMFRRFRPHLLLSDITMPVEDGYTLLRHVRALPPDQGGAVPAVALTALARAEDRQKSLRAGFSLHLAKPVHPEALVAAVHRLLRTAAPPSNEA